ncbi:isoprenyl transferase [Putridiphycobacter roseus]|uniref:Isoprenyl transferase n=1 Tax=Putridiphycobacter roseus TaxID=2219161 RepID=A0A2W1N4J8_9FLAO|nr:isoprenyl transferase [Putridiphycobacter roseus]PZE18520.1 isoprenyl transferase [Putridiphycobacter roseus]
MSIINKLNKDNIPQHIAIIMDGNGRWAKSKGQTRLFGHAMGVESVRRALTGATEAGVSYLTLYAFSTENWNRPKEEVDGLMSLLVDTITKEIEDLDKNNVIVKTIGDIDAMPGDCALRLRAATDKTAKNTGTTLILALNYSAKEEIKNAIKSIAQSYKDNEIEIEAIDNDLIDANLSTKGIPHPELLIRTSGEIRLSNFLLWQIAYSELYFSEKFWPDFTEEDLYGAIFDYQNRERRFGMVSEQINNK